MLRFYEYKIKGHPVNGLDKYYAPEIHFANNNECGLVDVDSSNNNNNNNTNTNNANEVYCCDILKNKPNKHNKNQSGGVLSIEQYYDIYLKLPIRGDINIDLYTHKIKDDILKLFDMLKNKNLEYIKTNSTLIIKDKYLDNIHDGSFIFNIDLKKKENIVIFGDIHGSYHTFFRHILRLYKMNVITSLDNWTLAPNYRIIFLGDVLDRGSYALEILTIICKLMYVNNTNKILKVIYNRGNHETQDIYMRYGFGEELSKKLNNLSYFKKFISTLPSAIVLTGPNMKIWLSHGGIPYISNDNISDEIYTVPLDKVVYIDKEEPDITVSTSIPDQIRWNDFAYNKHTKMNVGYMKRNIGYEINQDYLIKFCIHNKITKVIRAHQDNFFNSSVLSNNKDKNYRCALNDSSNIHHSIIRPLYDKHGRSKKELCSMDCTYDTFHLNKYDDLIIYPVITLSTNTDKSRNLGRDSIAILSV